MAALSKCWPLSRRAVSGTAVWHSLLIRETAFEMLLPPVTVLAEHARQNRCALDLHRVQQVGIEVDKWRMVGATCIVSTQLVMVRA